MPVYADQTTSSKNLCTHLLNQYAGKMHLKVDMNGLLKIKTTKKRGKILFTYGVQSISQK